MGSVGFDQMRRRSSRWVPVEPAISQNILVSCGWVKCLGVDLVTGFEQDHCEFIGLEQGVEFLGQVDGMARIGEGHLLVLGAWVGNQDIMRLEIDGTIVVENRPDTFATQHLVAFVSCFVDVFDQHCRFRSRHFFDSSLPFIYLQ